MSEGFKITGTCEHVMETYHLACHQHLQFVPSVMALKVNTVLNTDDIFKWIFLNENVWISIKISLKFVPKGPINNIPALVQIMAWRWSGDKPLYEPSMVILSTRKCVTRPQWVNPSNEYSVRAVKTKSCHDANFVVTGGTIGSCFTTVYNATSDSKVGIMTTFGFQYHNCM